MLEGVYPGDPSDMTVPTREIRFNSSQYQEVEIIFRADSVTQERNETVTLELIPMADFPTQEAIFFRKNIDMIIIDTDGKYVIVNNDDFSKNLQC